MNPATRQQAIDTLHESECSCVICNGGSLRTFHQHGVKDLLHILRSEPLLLRGAFVADKVIGKGAAALMTLGGVTDIFADVISRPALEMLTSAGIPAEYKTLTDNIINRSGNGICPVEQLCLTAKTAEECLPLIMEFIDKQKKY